MSLLQRIKQDQLAARKAKDKFKATLLTTLLAEASRPGLDDGKRESTDREVVEVCKKFIDNMKESLKANYTEAVHTEMCIVYEYMPQALDEEDMKDIATYVIESNTKPNIGTVMAYFKKNYVGQYDGNVLSSIVKQLLNGGG